MQENPNSIMVVLSSDHSIQNVRSFEQNHIRRHRAGKNNLFVTVGIQPTYPATGFGYIEQGLPLITLVIFYHHKTRRNHPTGYSVRSFRENQIRPLRNSFYAHKKILMECWYFVWKTKTFWMPTLISNQKRLFN